MMRMLISRPRALHSLTTQRRDIFLRASLSVCLLVGGLLFLPFSCSHMLLTLHFHVRLLTKGPDSFYRYNQYWKTELRRKAPQLKAQKEREDNHQRTRIHGKGLMHSEDEWLAGESREEMFGLVGSRTRSDERSWQARAHCFFCFAYLFASTIATKHDDDDDLYFHNDNESTRPFKKNEQNRN